MKRINNIFETQNTLIVAEVGINHNGNFNKLVKLVEKAKESGADAVKFQIFSEKLFYIPEEYLPKDLITSIPIEIFRKTFIPFKRYEEVFNYSRQIGIIPFATPLDIESFEFLDNLGVDMFKIASSDITYIPLLKRIAKTQKLTLISTGFSTIKEVKRYIKLLKPNPLVIMFCVSRYPSHPKDLSLKEFIIFKKTFENIKRKRIVGFSDHTKTLSLPTAIVALGAKVVEKHLTLDENDDSYDNIVSISPEKFKTLVEMIREIEYSLSSPSRNLPDDFVKKMSIRSLVARKPISKGEKIIEDSIEALRPGIFKVSSIENWRKILNKESPNEYKTSEPL